MPGGDKDSRGQQGSSSSNVVYQELEFQIDKARLDQDWESIKENLKKYAHIFDITGDVSTNLHTNAKEMKCYYWLCQSEVSFHLNGDFVASIDCLRRAVAFHYPSLEVRILIVRYFLYACKETMNKFKSSHGHRKRISSLNNFDMENLQLVLYLGEFASVSRAFLVQSLILHVPLPNRFLAYSSRGDQRDSEITRSIACSREERARQYSCHF